ncbi:MAG: peptidase domain-containing ABC transporter [Geminocystis sp.]|nr:peptidase domain-containing ABC transporter [Geminocystis sp.]HIK37471.1 peptidase domain-containing ABC transporter [Geminocystis sp. M7585_C2015_104]
MVHTVDAVTGFLSQIEPFKRLSPDVLEGIAKQCQPLKYDIGQIIVVKDKIPPYVAIVYEGEARCIGYDPPTGQPVSIQKVGRGAIIGWENLIREIPLETAIASTPLIALTFNREKFLEIIRLNPPVREYFQGIAGIHEVFYLLGLQLSRKAIAFLELKEITKETLSECQVLYLAAGKNRQLPQPPEKQAWVLSAGQVEGKSIGDAIAPQESINLTSDCRFISLPNMDLIASDSSEEVSYGQPQQEIASKTESGTDLNLTNSVSPTEDIPQAKEEEVLEASTHTTVSSGRASGRKYPFEAGRGEVGVGIACMRMLCRYYKMPFRGEVLQRIIKEQVERNKVLSLEACGAICELMGLNAQLIQLPAGAISKLEGPFLTRLSDSLVVVYQANDKTCTVADPTLRGLREFKTLDFLRRWGDRGKVLLLKKTKETPQKKFGLSWFIPAIVKYKWTLLEVFVSSFFVQLFALANPLMIQVVIDKVLVQNSPDTLHVLGIFLLVLGIFEALLSTIRTYSFVDTTNRIDMALGSEIIDHLLRLPLRYFEKRPVGELATRINELENIRSFLTGTALTVVLDAVFSVIYIVVMFIYSPFLSLVALGIIPVFIALTLIFSPLIRHQLRVRAERNAATQAHLVEVISGIQTVKAQNIELKARWEWQERYARYIGAGFKTVITETLAGATGNFLNKLSQLLVLWVGAYQVLDGKMTLGQLIAFRIIAGYVTYPILRLAQLWQNFQQTALSLERLADIVDHPEEGEQDRDNIPMPPIKGHVKYENVCFRFKPNSPLQLNNVTIEIPAGTFVGIVGESGAGKSTFTKLLARLYEPESGRILIDGYDINRVELYSLRRQIGVVPQESLLFDGTIFENIALTSPSATAEEVVKAAQIAVAHEFIMSLPNGYNTRVGERGAALSGGQRQRIAIARSVLQNPRLLILDEATSALDYNTEAQVCQNLIHFFKGRTVLFITHRLATVRNADLIILMHNGIIAEKGTHEELMALRGRYFHLWQQQQKYKN